jgi:hypothetical protein
MTDTARLALPLLAAGQAQKEMTVNEALTRLDLAVQPTVAEIGRNLPPVAPTEGEAWIVGAAPTDAWSGHAGALAGWTAGGWRFLAPREGWRVWSSADGCAAVYSAGAWRLSVANGPRAAPISGPIGGAVVDAEARAVLASVLAALRAHGLVAS